MPVSQPAVDSAAGIVVCDAAGTILFISPQVEKTFGYPSVELVGRPVDELLSSALPDRTAPLPSGSGWAWGSSRLTARRRNGSEVAIDVVRTVLERSPDAIAILSIAEIGERGEPQGRTVQTARARDPFERLVTELASRFVLMRSEQMDDAIADSLRQISEALDLDRSSWWNVPPDSEDAFLTHAWTRAGYRVVPSGESARAHVPWVMSRLQRGEIVSFSDSESVPSSADREGLRRLGTKSGVAIPVCSEGKLRAVLGFSTSRAHREWPPDIVDRLRLVAAVVGQTILRRESENSLQRALVEMKQLRAQLAMDHVELRRDVKTLGVPRMVVAESPAAKRVLSQIESVAPTDATVLLLGETGSGKEVFAQAIHRFSERHGRPMVTVSCAAIPSTLIESELFGRERGAYTGALARQIGRFEMAHESTLFLDEIGDLPLDAQVKLLRVLQEKVIERLGGGQPVKVNVRIIAATNRNLEKAVEERTFREDLFYRLNVFPIVIPPLRQRLEDIPALAWAFIDEYSQAFRKPIESISKESLAALQRYSWPGNVRELRNVIERAVIVSKGPRLVVDLPVAPAVTTKTSMRLDDLETQQIKTVLESVGWRVRGPGGAAELLGIKPNTLDSRMAKLGIFRRPRESTRRD
jgi:PAS domain S-box-containing protein